MISASSVHTADAQWTAEPPPVTYPVILGWESPAFEKPSFSKHLT